MKIISLLLCLLVVFSNSKAYGFVGSTEVVSNFVSNIVSLHSCYSALLALCFISKESISFRIFLLPFESLFLGVSLWGMGKYINYSYLNIVFGLVAWRCFLADTLLSYMLPSKDEYSF